MTADFSRLSTIAVDKSVDAAGRVACEARRGAFFDALAMFSSDKKHVVIQSVENSHRLAVTQSASRLHVA
jgi:hypothetical protein